MGEEERPVHVVHDLATGATTMTPVTDEEWEAMKAVERDASEAFLVQEKAAEDLRAEVDAHPDPLVRLLARKAGLA